VYAECQQSYEMRLLVTPTLPTMLNVSLAHKDSTLLEEKVLYKTLKGSFRHFNVWDWFVDFILFN